MLCFLRKMKRVEFFPKINVPRMLYIRREIEIVARALLRYGRLDNDPDHRTVGRLSKPTPFCGCCASSDDAHLATPKRSSFPIDQRQAFGASRRDDAIGASTLHLSGPGTKHTPYRRRGDQNHRRMYGVRQCLTIDGFSHSSASSVKCWMQSAICTV